METTARTRTATIFRTGVFFLYKKAIYAAIEMPNLKLESIASRRRIVHRTLCIATDKTQVIERRNAHSHDDARSVYIHVKHILGNKHPSTEQV